MKKRLRKKLRLREFQEMGFQTAFDLAISNEDEEKERLYAFWDCLVEVVEANHLMMGGALDNFFVCTDSRCSATEVDRSALRNWLETQPEASNVTIGPLVDAWHGKFE